MSSDAPEGSSSAVGSAASSESGAKRLDNAASAAIVQPVCQGCFELILIGFDLFQLILICFHWCKLRFPWIIL